jgi:hypothetical protein
MKVGVDHATTHAGGGTTPRTALGELSSNAVESSPRSVTPGTKGVCPVVVHGTRASPVVNPMVSTLTVSEDVQDLEALLAMEDFLPELEAKPTNINLLTPRKHQRSLMQAGVLDVPSPVKENGKTSPLNSSQSTCSTDLLAELSADVKCLSEMPYEELSLTLDELESTASVPSSASGMIIAPSQRKSLTAKISTATPSSTRKGATLPSQRAGSTKSTPNLTLVRRKSASVVQPPEASASSSSLAVAKAEAGVDNASVLALSAGTPANSDEKILGAVTSLKTFPESKLPRYTPRAKQGSLDFSPQVKPNEDSRAQACSPDLQAAFSSVAASHGSVEDSQVKTASARDSLAGNVGALTPVTPRSQIPRLSFGSSIPAPNGGVSRPMPAPNSNTTPRIMTAYSRIPRATAATTPSSANTSQASSSDTASASDTRAHALEETEPGRASKEASAVAQDAFTFSRAQPSRPRPSVPPLPLSDAPKPTIPSLGRRSEGNSTPRGRSNSISTPRGAKRQSVTPQPTTPRTSSTGPVAITPRTSSTGPVAITPRGLREHRQSNSVTWGHAGDGLACGAAAPSGVSSECSEQVQQARNKMLQTISPSFLSPRTTWPQGLVAALDHTPPKRPTADEVFACMRARMREYAQGDDDACPAKTVARMKGGCLPCKDSRSHERRMLALQRQSLA